MDKSWLNRPWAELATFLALGLFACLSLFLYSIVLNHSIAFPYLVINLFLALVPLLLSWRLGVSLRHRRWSDWEPLLLTFLWLLFLPGSFYVLSDFIHLQLTLSSTILYDTTLFSAFVFVSMFMGFASLYQVHSELKKRIRPLSATLIMIVVLLGCSFALYLGRDLRWDSWDIVVNPGALLFDISNVLLKPSNYSYMARTVFSFFIFIGVTYALVFRAARLQWKRGASDLAARIKRDQHS